MRRSALQRNSLRRSGGNSSSAVVTSINGLTGAVLLESPMLTQSGNTIRHDNANPKQLTDAASIVGIDAEVNNGFYVTITAIRTFAAPSNPRHMEKITFTIRQSGGSFVPLWTGGAGGYQFAAAGSDFGITQAQADELASLTPANSYYKIGFEYDSAIGQWVCVALAGWWT